MYWRQYCGLEFSHATYLPAHAAVATGNQPNHSVACFSRGAPRVAAHIAHTRACTELALHKSGKLANWHAGLAAVEVHCRNHDIHHRGWLQSRGGRGMATSTFTNRSATDSRLNIDPDDGTLFVLVLKWLLELLCVFEGPSIRCDIWHHAQAGHTKLLVMTLGSYGGTW